MFDFVTELDFSLLYAIQDALRSTFLDALMVLFTSAFNGGMFWFLLCACLLVFRKTRGVAVCVLLSMAVTLLVGELGLKNITCRLRPCVVDSSIPLALELPRSYSFPSGHTASSFAAATVIFSFNKKWGTGALCLAALVGFSRLYLFVHFPTDVLAGMVLGILSGVFAVFVFRKYKLNEKIINLRQKKTES